MPNYLHVLVFFCTTLFCQQSLTFVSLLNYFVTFTLSINDSLYCWPIAVLFIDVFMACKILHWYHKLINQSVYFFSTIYSTGCYFISEGNGLPTLMMKTATGEFIQVIPVHSLTNNLTSVKSGNRLVQMLPIGVNNLQPTLLVQPAANNNNGELFFSDFSWMMPYMGGNPL